MLARWRLVTELALRAFDERVGLIPFVTMRVVERWFGTQRGAAVTDVVVEPEGRDRPGGPIPCLGLAIVFGSIAERVDEPARAAVEQPVGEHVSHLVVVLLQLIDGGLDAFPLGADLVGIAELSLAAGFFPPRTSDSARSSISSAVTRKDRSSACASRTRPRWRVGGSSAASRSACCSCSMVSSRSLASSASNLASGRVGRAPSTSRWRLICSRRSIRRLTLATRLARLCTVGGDLLCRGAARGAVGRERGVVLAARGWDLVDGEVLVVPDQHPPLDSGKHVRSARGWACLSGCQFVPLGASAILGRRSTGACLPVRGRARCSSIRRSDPRAMRPRTRPRRCRPASHDRLGSRRARRDRRRIPLVVRGLRRRRSRARRPRRRRGGLCRGFRCRPGLERRCRGRSPGRRRPRVCHRSCAPHRARRRRLDARGRRR